MSAINIAVSPDGGVGYLICDSLAYLPDGRVVGHARKVHTFPHANAVIGARGPLLALNRLMRKFERCDDFDAMVDLLRDKIPRLPSTVVWRIINAAWKRLLQSGKFADLSAGSASGRVRGFHAIELVLVGYSSRMGRIVALAATSEGGFEPVESNVFLAPGLPREEEDRLPRLDPANRDAWPSVLLNILQVQRRLFLASPEREIIGGTVVLTTVTKKTISQLVLYRWRDTVGGRPLCRADNRRRLISAATSPNGFMGVGS